MFLKHRYAVYDRLVRVQVKQWIAMYPDLFKVS